VNRNIVAAIIVAGGLITAAFLSSGRYVVTRLDQQTLARTDRWTGDTQFCSVSEGCQVALEWEYDSSQVSNSN
jgi:hypothetical protein